MKHPTASSGVCTLLEGINLRLVRRSARLFAALAALALLIIILCAGSALADTGNHFILLLDDSGDMRGYSRLMAEHLPEYLFNGSPSGSENRRPSFNPHKDTLSIVFFGIYSRPAWQGAHNRYLSKAGPRDLFKLHAAASPCYSRTHLRANLRTALKEPERFRARFSPIITSPLVVLPFINRHLEKSDLFSRVFIIQATNEVFNMASAVSSPGAELAAWRSTGCDEIEGYEKTMRLAHRVNSGFSFHANPHWRKKCSQSGGKAKLTIAAMEVKPLAPPPDSLITVNPGIKLERKAICGDRLTLSCLQPRADCVFISLTGGLTPIRLSLALLPPGERARPAGRGSINHKTLNLQDQASGQIIRDKHRLGVSLLNLFRKTLTINTGQSFRPEYRFQLKADFLFTGGGLYNHIRRQSNRHTVTARLALNPLLPTQGLLPAMEVDEGALLASWSPEDTQGLTQSRLADRLRQSRRSLAKWTLAAGAAILLLLLIILFAVLHATAYRRPFHLEPMWQPAGPLTLDFSQPTSTKMLIGTMHLKNPRKVPWFGRWMRNKEQPVREGKAEVETPDLKAMGFVTAEALAIGFAAQDEGKIKYPDERLRPSCSLTLGHGQQVFLFLDANAIKDRKQPPQPGRPHWSRELKLNIRLSWKTACKKESGEIDSEILFTMKVLPERPRPPRAAPQKPRRGEMEFQKGKAIETGAYDFISSAEKRYSLPHTADYNLSAKRNGSRLYGDMLRLKNPTVTISYGQRLKRDVLLEMDGEIISNPDPARGDRYTYRLLGQNADSGRGQWQGFTLHRDSTLCRMELTIESGGAKADIFWPPEGGPPQALISTQDGEEETKGLPDSVLRLNEIKVGCGPGGGTMARLMKIVVGNSGSSGDGSVKISLAKKLILTPESRRCLTLAGTRQEPSGLVNIHDWRSVSTRALIKEGDPPATREVRMDASAIESIDGIEIEADQCRLEISLKAVTKNDQGKVTKNHLEIILPLNLVQNPLPNWLALDIGTEAIAAAYGGGGRKDTHIIDLQKLATPPGFLCLADYDPENLEKNTCFLPSMVVVDPDQRQSEPDEHQKDIPPGFSGYRRASLVPGRATFLGLPALFFDLHEKTGRIVHSPKAWLASGGAHIRLREKITYQDGQGRSKTSDLLNTTDVVQSCLAALAKAYLKPFEEYRAGQVVLTYPNTYTPYHLDLFRHAASAALVKGLGLDGPRRIRFIAESDAVAFFHCDRKRREHNPSGTERILVYDFGAGTLDISLIQVEWSGADSGLAGWKRSGSLGLPIAGNYIDEILAHIIHQELSNPDRLPKGLFYKYPLVADQAQPDHAQVVYRFWLELRKAKHNWQSDKPFTVTLGHIGDSLYLVNALYAQSGDPAKKNKKNPSKPVDKEKNLDETIREELAAKYKKNDDGLWVDKTGSIKLSLPPGKILGHPLMSEFVQFATEEVITEALAQPGWKPEQVDTIIVSGRGARWADITNRVLSRFPRAVRPDLNLNGGMKEAVAQGAVAWQRLAKAEDLSQAEWAKRKVRLGILLGDTLRLHLEKPSPWEVDLEPSATFNLLQINTVRPNYKKDRHTLRRFLYVDLPGRSFNRDQLCGSDYHMEIVREVKEGELKIDFKTRTGGVQTAFTQTNVQEISQEPPWPVGKLLLSPLPQSKSADKGGRPSSQQ